MNEAQSERRAHRLALAQMAQKKPHVLVADDQHAELIQAADLLVRCGIRVDQVTGGEAAIGRILDADEMAIRYDLLLIDLVMPHCDGLEAARALRIAGYSARVLPILVLLEPASPLLPAAANTAGIQGALIKPLSFDELVPALNRLLPHRIVGEDCIQPPSPRLA